MQAVAGDFVVVVAGDDLREALDLLHFQVGQAGYILDDALHQMPCTGEAVEVGRFDLPTLIPKIRESHVIDEDENDIRSFRRFRNEGEDKREKKQKDDREFHENRVGK